MNQALKLTKMKVSTTIATRIFNPNRHPLLRRHISTTVASKEYISQKINEVGSTGGNVTDVLQGISESGQRVTRDTVVDCFKELLNKGHNQQCLEILDWLEKDITDLPGRDFPLRIDILHKLKGLDEAEDYFDGIPSKSRYVYGSLLNCYCTDLETDKAFATFKEMDEMGFAASNVLAYNNLLNLCLKIKHPEMVPQLISEMKQNHLPLNSHAYSFWIQSYRLLGDVAGVERVFHEAQEDILVKDDWVIHSNVVSVFIEFGQFEKALSHLEKLENDSDNLSRNSFQHLISLYAGAGKLDSVIRTWNKLKSKFKVEHKQSYLSLLQALSRLDDIKGLENYFHEWESICKKHYDDRVPAVVIGAYLRHDMVKEAELLLKDATEKAGKVLRWPHVKFMKYYLEKGQTECALKHMEAAIVSKWKPLAEKLDPWFQHFKDEKDVVGLEKFCELLKRTQALDIKAYLWLLETYVDAEKTAPDMRQRIKKDGIIVTPELEELLERVCPGGV
ncbi:pentatricopeptide repeat-containing protein At1g02370, mitochondrial-like isoform X2 [Silene latifolia]|uniref:pentatricopeptide repeat-containing protein At1g02370, mitochondrial-like isoform X2 n=1 Tax=Silene latifolia TaxID=37657 RepID=UPI003D783424